MIAALLVLAAQLALSQRTPAIVSRARLDTTQAVNFRVLVSPDTVYVGQQTLYELGVFLDGSVRDRLRRMEAIAPEMRGMMAYDPPAPLAGFPTRAAGARRYEAHVYQRAVFPLAAGRLVIPPARLVYAMPLSYSFFSREESYEVQSDSVVVEVLDPPRATRPDDWNGAVGTPLSVSARFDTSATRVGDPVLLTVVVRGRGNVKLLPRPRLDVVWASAVPAGERVALDADSLDIRGTKEFDWVLTPTRAGRLTLPALRYPYFDPVQRRYAVALSPSMALSVAPGALAATATPDSGVDAPQPRLGVRTAYRGALPSPPYERRPFWWVLMLAPLPALVLAVTRRERRPRAMPERSGARRLRALARPSSRAGADARVVRRTFVHAVAERLGVSPAAIAEPAALARAARRAGATPDTVADAAAFLAALDSTAFARESEPLADAAACAWRLWRALDAESRRLRAPRGPVAMALLALALLSGGARALAPDADATQFARGVAAYGHGHFSIAARDFAAVAQRVPRASDAWANLGTAAFAAGDTGRATLGWQRALRLEPTAGDVRDHLDLVGATTVAGPGAVPPVPPVPLALVAAALWLGGWGALAWGAARRRLRGVTALAAAALGGALAFGGAAATIDRRLAARDLAVVAHDVPLHLLPALASETGATVRTGEVARIAEREGEWVRVVADGGRDGWTDAASLYPLARD